MKNKIILLFSKIILPSIKSASKRKAFISIVAAGVTFYLCTFLPFFRSNVLPSLNAANFTKSELNIIGDTHGFITLRAKEQQKGYSGTSMYLIKITNTAESELVVKKIFVQLANEDNIEYGSLNPKRWNTEYIYMGSYPSTYETRVIEFEQIRKGIERKKLDFHVETDYGDAFKSKFDLTVFRIPSKQTEYIPVSISIYPPNLNLELNEVNLYGIKIIVECELLGEDKIFEIDPDYGLFVTYFSNEEQAKEFYENDGADAPTRRIIGGYDPQLIAKENYFFQPREN